MPTEPAMIINTESPDQPEAISSYERCGFVRCAPFGDYREDPLSLFMHKRL